MIRYFIDGGIFMWIILFTSIFGVTIILEKLWMLYTRERDLERKYRKQIYLLERWKIN